jgi:acyl-coenzyme A synthetase/AMP-(fatty) acid ligase
MPRNDLVSLWSLLRASGQLQDVSLIGTVQQVNLADLERGSAMDCDIEQLRGGSVLVATQDQLSAALALIELDGIARRLILCPPVLLQEHVAYVAATGEANTLLCDKAISQANAAAALPRISCSPVLRPVLSDRRATEKTEWVLLTSGTTGKPKLVLHSLSTLTGAIKATRHHPSSVVWSTFYDIRRYGGLQILLRALVDGASLVLSSATESTEEFLMRAAANGVTHISGTPSHWRLALMSPAAHRFVPRYVRLSGEAVSQLILDNLKAAYPEATIVHAFASTEAGVAFEVGDGLAGFPASLLGVQGSGVEMKIENGSLRIRSPRVASCYLGNSVETLKGLDGFIDTRDLVDRRDQRYYFSGRADGVINVGGLKVHPEEVEEVINRHPAVRMSLVKARRNPITGSLVVADVVTQSAGGPVELATDTAELKSEILESCRQALAPYKVPAAIRFVASLEMTASGKLARH